MDKTVNLFSLAAWSEHDSASCRNSFPDNRGHYCPIGLSMWQTTHRGPHPNRKFYLSSGFAAGCPRYWSCASKPWNASQKIPQATGTSWVRSGPCPP